MGSWFSLKNELPAQVQEARKNAENLRLLFNGVKIDEYIKFYVFGGIMKKAERDGTSLMSTYAEIGKEIPARFELKWKYKRLYKKTGNAREYIKGIVMSRDYPPDERQVDIMLTALRFEAGKPDRIYLTEKAARLVQKCASKAGIDLRMKDGEALVGEKPAPEPIMKEPAPAKKAEAPVPEKKIEIPQKPSVVDMKIKPLLTYIRGVAGIDGASDDKILSVLRNARELINPKKPVAESTDMIVAAFFKMPQSARETYYALLFKEAI